MCSGLFMATEPISSRRAFTRDSGVTDEACSVRQRIASCHEPMRCRTEHASSVTPESRVKARRELIGSVAMNNPLHILQTLDRHLTRPAEITIFGRAALALGFSDSPAPFATTHDV